MTPADGAPPPPPAPGRRLHLPKRPLALVALLGIVALLFWSVARFQSVFFASVHTIDQWIQAHPVAGALTFTGLAAASALLSFFSSVPLVPVAALVFGKVNAALLLLAGWVLGSSAAYGLARFIGYPLLKRVVSLEKLDYYRGRLIRRRGFGLILLFRLAMPAEIAGYVLGLMRYHFGWYLLATILSELPFAIMAVFVSDAVLAQRPVRFVGLVALTALIMSALYHRFHSALDEEHPDAPPSG